MLALSVGPASPQLPGYELGGGDDEGSKRASAEQRAIGAPDAAGPVAQETVDPGELVESRLFRRPDQHFYLCPHMVALENVIEGLVTVKGMAVNASPSREP